MDSAIGKTIANNNNNKITGFRFMPDRDKVLQISNDVASKARVSKL